MESRSRGAITSSSHPYLADELAAASRLVRDACGWHIAKSERVSYVRRGPDREAVWLPAMRIASIDAVTIDGVEWDADRLARVEFDSNLGWTNLAGRRVDVLYTAGFDPVPEAIVSLVLQVAARALGSPLGFVRESAGSVSITHTQVGFNQAGGTSLLPAEEAVLVPYKIGRLP